MEARQSCREPTLMQRSRLVMRRVLAGMPDARFGIMAFERLAFPVTQMTYDHGYLAEVIEHGLFVGLIYERTATQFAILAIGRPAPGPARPCLARIQARASA